jgi:hypothetical protein
MFSAADQAPARTWRVIVPSDTVNLPAGCRGIYVGGGGNITAVGEDNVAVLFTAVPVGVFAPIAPKRINATGTAATLMIGLW